MMMTAIASHTPVRWKAVVLLRKGSVRAGWWVADGRKVDGSSLLCGARWMNVSFLLCTRAASGISCRLGCGARSGVIISTSSFYLRLEQQQASVNQTKSVSLVVEQSSVNHQSVQKDTPGKCCIFSHIFSSLEERVIRGQSLIARLCFSVQGEEEDFFFRAVR